MRNHRWAAWPAVARSVSAATSAATTPRAIRIAGPARHVVARPGRSRSRRAGIPRARTYRASRWFGPGPQQASRGKEPGEGITHRHEGGEHIRAGERPESRGAHNAGPAEQQDPCDQIKQDERRLIGWDERVDPAHGPCRERHHGAEDQRRCQHQGEREPRETGALGLWRGSPTTRRLGHSPRRLLK
jgi:hypothetical protein